MSLIRVEPGKHSRLGASGAKRWMSCPGSNNLIRKLGDHAGRSGVEAARGTAAHAIAALCLTTGKEAWEYANTWVEVDGWKFVVDEDMMDSITEYCDFIFQKSNEFAAVGPGVAIEKGMQSELHDDAYGTADCIIYVPGDRIIIIDFKNGMGVVVEPDDPQLRYYGYLANETRPDYMRGKGNDPTTVEMWIVQPRLIHSEGSIRKYEESVESLNNWFSTAVIKAMAATEDPKAPLVVGDWCRFCPARDNCPALKKEAIDFPVDKEPELLTEVEIGMLLSKGDIIRKYIDKLQTIAFVRATQGNKIPGYKLVRKISKRQWKDGATDAMVNAYGDAVLTEPELRSPAQIEKQLGDIPGSKQLVEDWSYKPDKGLTLAAESDTRKEVSSLQYDPMLLDEPINL